MPFHLAPSSEQPDRMSMPANDHSPYISGPLTHGSTVPKKNQFYDRLGPGIYKCVVFLLGLACGVSFGSITTAVGNEILSNTHPSHSTNTETAAIVGSIGGIFAYGLPLLCYFSLDVIRTSLKEQGFVVFFVILTITNFACAAVLGPLGCIIYLKAVKRNSGPGGLNIRNATLMGIIGGSFWMILVIGLSGYLTRTPKSEAEKWNTTTAAYQLEEQRRDLDIAFAHK